MRMTTPLVDLSGITVTVAGSPGGACAAGLDVEVGLPAPELVVPVGERLKVWLPVVLAMTANSPFAGGTDTGWASWRFVEARRRALGHLAPGSRHGAVGDEAAAAVRAAGAVVSQAMLPSHVAPVAGRSAMRVRAGDLCATGADTVLVVALLRGVVAATVSDMRAGHAAVRYRAELIEEAYWDAARHGLNGTLTDPRLGRVRPAWEMVDEFFAIASPGLLAAGDLDLVLDGLTRLREQGTGADRQHRVAVAAQHLARGTGAEPRRRPGRVPAA